MENYPEDDSSDPDFFQESWGDLIDKLEKRQGRLYPVWVDAQFRIIQSNGELRQWDRPHTYAQQIHSRHFAKKTLSAFNDLLLYYPDLRQQWFAYKSEAYIAYVKDLIQLEEQRCDWRDIG